MSARQAGPNDGNIALTADEMSGFYREFSNFNLQKHKNYNKEWHKKNLKLLWPGVKAFFGKCRREFLRWELQLTLYKQMENKEIVNETTVLYSVPKKDQLNIPIRIITDQHDSCHTAISKVLNCLLRDITHPLWLEIASEKNQWFK